MCFVCGPAAHHETTKATKEIATVFENCNVNVNVDANACPDNALSTAVKRETEREREQSTCNLFPLALHHLRHSSLLDFADIYLNSVLCVLFVRLSVCVYVCLYYTYTYTHPPHAHENSTVCRNFVIV